MRNVMRVRGQRIILIVVFLGMILAPLVSAQVVQRRTHNIQQSGSGAPVVSITSTDQAVQSRRTVQQNPEGGSSTAYVQTSDQRRIRNPTAATANRYQTTQNGQGSGTGTQNTPQHVGSVTVSQSSRATGENVGLIQRIVLAIDSLMGRQTIQARTAVRGRNPVIRQELSSVTTPKVSNTVINSQGGSQGNGVAVTQQRIDTQTPEGNTTVQSQDVSRGRNPVVARRLTVQQQGGSVVVSTGTVNQDESSVGQNNGQNSNVQGASASNRRQQFDLTAPTQLRHAPLVAPTQRR